jgi:hypothetical protein
MGEAIGGTVVFHSDVRDGELDELARIPTMTFAEDYHRGPGENRGYSWLEDYLARLDGKEARQEYYLGLE